MRNKDLNKNCFKIKNLDEIYHFFFRISKQQNFFQHQLQTNLDMLISGLIQKKLIWLKCQTKF